MASSDTDENTQPNHPWPDRPINSDIQTENTSEGFVSKETDLPELEVDGKKFISTSLLAQEIGYDSDHIGRLARQGKVESIRNGKRWYVYRPSLEEYRKRADENKRTVALESIKLPPRGLKANISRRLIVPSLDLFHIAEHRASKVSFRQSFVGSLKLTFLALFIFSLSLFTASEFNAPSNQTASIFSTIQTIIRYLFEPFLDSNRYALENETKDIQTNISSGQKTNVTAPVSQVTGTRIVVTLPKEIQDRIAALEQFNNYSQIKFDNIDQRLSVTPTVFTGFVGNSGSITTTTVDSPVNNQSVTTQTLTVSGAGTISGNLTVDGYASASQYFGANLSDCDASADTLNWDSTTGKFSCGTDSGAGTAEIKIEKSGTTVLATTGTLNFDDGQFSPTSSGSTETIVRLDWDTGPASLSQDETVTGFWTFSNNVSISSQKNFEVTGYASASSYFGSAFSAVGDCNDADDTLGWDNGVFICGTDLSSGGGGGSGTLQIRELGLFDESTAATISFEPGHFALTSSGSSDDVIVKLDWTNGPASRSASQTISGLWNFTAASAQFNNLVEIGTTASIGGNIITRGRLDVTLSASVSGNFEATTFKGTTYSGDGAVLVTTGTGDLSLDSFGNNVAITANASVSNNFEIGSDLFAVRSTGASTSLPFETTVYASSSKYYGASLSSCSGASNALTWNSGLFGCNTITGGTSFNGIEVTNDGGSTFKHVGSMSFDANMFDVTFTGSPASTSLVKLDWTNGPASLSQDETVSGGWIFNNDLIINNIGGSAFAKFSSVSSGRFGLGDLTSEAYFEVASASGITASISNTFFVDGGNQRVGIGTAAPAYNFTVVGSVLALMETDNDAPAAIFGSGATSGAMYLYNGGSATTVINGALYSNSYINTGGNFGISTLTPDVRFEVNGAASISQELNLYGVLNAGLSGSTASVAYNRFGTGVATAPELTWINNAEDLFISDSLYVSASISANIASISNFRLTDSATGVGMVDCDGDTQALGWDTATGRFFCGVDATGGGGGTQIEVTGSAVSGDGGTRTSSLSFEPADFNITDMSGWVLVGLDWTNGPASLSQDESVTGGWIFNNDLIINNIGGSAFAKFASTSSGRFGLGDLIPEAYFEVASSSGITASISNTFYVDGSNKRVGIGTNAPANALTVSGDANFTGSLTLGSSLFSNTVYGGVNSGNSLTLQASLNNPQSGYVLLAPTGGRVGLGTVSPDSIFHIASASSKLTITSTGATSSTSIAFEPSGGASSSNQAKFTIEAGGTGTASESLTFKNINGTRLMTIASNGYVGIGTSAPQDLLHVSGGNIRLDNEKSLIFEALDGTIGSTMLIDNANTLKINNLAPFGSTTLTVNGGTFNITMLGANGLSILNNGNTGIGTVTPTVRFVVVGAASISQELNLGGVLNAGLTGGTASVAYNRFGVGTVSLPESNWISDASDLLISGDLYGIGSVAFQGTASLSNTLLVDSINKRVGIGTSAPRALLDVGGYGTPNLGYDVVAAFRGSLTATQMSSIEFKEGINTYGSIVVIGEGSNNALSLAHYGAGNVSTLYGFPAYTVNSVLVPINLILGSTGNGVGNTVFVAGNTEKMRLNSSGYFGIGTTTPIVKFSVQGAASISDELNLGGALNAGLTGGTASVAYNRFGTGVATAPELTWINNAEDLFISDSLYVSASISANIASISNFRLRDSFTGVGMIDCDQDTQALGWDHTTGRFFCGDDDAGSGGGATPITVQAFGDSASRFQGRVSISFDGLDFNAAASGSGDVTINLDWVTGPASRGADQTITGLWTFGNHVSVSSNKNFEVAGGFASASKYFGGGLTDCDTIDSKLLWDASTGNYSCATEVAQVKMASASAGLLVTIASVSLGINVTITPQSIESEILIQLTANYMANSSTNGMCGVSIRRGTLSSDPVISRGGMLNDTLTTDRGTVAIIAVTGPRTTSPVTYSAWANCSADNLQRISERAMVLQEVNMGADLAELYGTSDKSISIGDVVSIDSGIENGVRKSIQYDKNLLGVVSTRPGLVIGDGEYGGANVVPVALVGRIPVRVTKENGPIKPGDYLTSSAIPGVAMKATKAGHVIGKALSSFDGEGLGVVTVFVENGYFNGRALIDDTPSQEMDGKGILTSLINYSQNTSSSFGSEINTDRITAGLEIITPKVITQEIFADRLVANIISAPASGSLTFDSDVFFENLFADKITAEEINSPVLVELKDMLTTQASISQSLDNRITIIENGLTIDNTTLMAGMLTVDQIGSSGDAISILSDTIFFGRPIFNSDTGGFAVIHEGQQKVDIAFDKEYLELPIINITMRVGSPSLSAEELLSQNINYIIEQKDGNGFSILIDKPASGDISFGWTAIAVKNPKTFFSEKAQPIPTPIIIESTPTESPTPLVSPEPEIILEPASGSFEAIESPSPSPELNLESTPELIPDPTPEPMPEPTPELIPEVTPEPAPELTPEAN